MRLGTTLFCAYAVIFALCFAYPIAQVAGTVRLAYLESAEEPLVDMANLLAGLVGHATERAELDLGELYLAFDEVYRREVAAQIYSLLKQRVDVRVYITDAAGTVLFDSESAQTVGADYSQWRDVRRTLAGEYGARIQRDPEDPDAPAVLLVGAPIVVHGEITGVLTVAKPTTSINAFFRRSKPKLFRTAALSAGVALALCFLVSLWVTQQVGRLTRYADDVREGRRVPFPKLARTELRTMGSAFEKMREALAGQAYVEQYVQALTHELKSPISAIAGAAEILTDPHLAPPRREQFLTNIQSETRRIQNLVERMLKLSELEARRALPELVPVSMAAVINTILEAQEANLARKQLRPDVRLEADRLARGDAFLLHLAASNLVQNAIDWSPVTGCVCVATRQEDGFFALYVKDDGPGIPAFAKERIFEKFFSLPRPDTGKKSTGLGLNFVREVAALHHGAVELENRPEGGLVACLRLPA